ncbi:Ribosomal RNA small subunit methyltransferase E [compost metagenome]
MKKNSDYAKINIVLGPEGGLSPKEEKQLIEFGFIPVTLGNRILRAETVPLFVLSILNYENME